MIKKIFIAVVVIVGLAVLFSFIAKNTPVTLESSGFLPEFSIDELITKADMIVVGEVNAILPSRWNGPNGRNDPKNVSPEDIARIGGLFTDSLISINQILKGDVVESVVRVRSFIGETDKVRLVNEGEPSFVSKKTYLLFLAKDFSATAHVDPGAYIPVGAYQGAYEIVDGKAISGDDEWVLEELIAYIQNSLAQSIPAEPVVTEIPTDTPISTEISPSP